MIKRTFGDVKDEIRRVGGQTGLAPNDPRLPALVDLAQERLCVKGEWPFQYARLKFCQYGGVVSLPAEYETIVHSDICREHVPIFNSWYEFIEGGPGQQDRAAWVNVGVDRGESPVYRQPGSSGMLVKITSGTDERVSGVRPVITIFGYDENGLWIRSDRGSGTLTDGVDLELRGDQVANYDTSTVKFSQVTQVRKTVTQADVVLTFIDESGTEFEGARYRHYDTNPSFRTYQFTGIRNRETKLIHAIVRRRLLPVRYDTDPLVVTSVSALRLAVMGIALEDKGDIVAAKVAFASATEILQDEAHLYKSGQPKPTVEVAPIGTCGGVPEIW